MGYRGSERDSRKHDLLIYDYRKQGLRIIGITYPPGKISDVRSFIRSVGVNYEIAVGTKATKALFSHSDTPPMTVVIDREGNVRYVIEGILYPDEFEQKVKPLLSTRAVIRLPALPASGIQTKS
ncbi:MAG TPA: TlpA disulfide reductase family protein [Pyrinomonadaceae bacterium]|nr:TlpA disulfide reductase family protein [Pyrinomonadaceae bacterium]